MNNSLDSNRTLPLFAVPPNNITLPSVLREYAAIEHTDVVLLVFIAALLIVSVAGNFIIITAFCKSSRLRSPSNVLLLNLAMTGLIATVFALPVWMFTTVLPQLAVRFIWPCRIAAMVTVLFFIVAIFSLAAIAVDRYVYVCLPFRYQRLSTGKNVAIFLVGTWTYAFGLAMIPFIDDDIGEYVFRPLSISVCSQDFNNIIYTSVILGAAILPGYIAILSCNIRVFVVARRQANKIRNLETSIRNSQAKMSDTSDKSTIGVAKPTGLSDASVHFKRLNPWKRASVVVRKQVQRSRVLRTVLVILFVFLFSWTPFIVMAVHSAIFSVTPPAWLEFIVTYIFHASFVLNPLACVFVDKEYRTGVKKVLGLRRREVLRLAVRAFTRGGIGAAARVHRHNISRSGYRSDVGDSTIPSGTRSNAQDVFCIYNPSNGVANDNSELWYIIQK